MAPACNLYNDALLQMSEGGDGDGDGDFLPFAGGTAGTGGSGTGAGMSGGASSGSSSGDGGGPGGDTGSGGDASCTEPPENFTGVSETLLLDDFNIDWPKLNSSTPEWNGSWSTIKDNAGATLTPLAATSIAWAEGGYTPLCTASKMALRVEAMGSDSWGVSFDGKLIEPTTDEDLSDYQGVIFWARSDNGSRIRLGFAEAATPNMSTEASVPPLAATWTQYKIPFPSGVATNIAIVKIVGFNSPSDETKKIDFMIDEISFYKN